MSRDMVCLRCPLSDCREEDPGCLLKSKYKNSREEDILLPFGLRSLARRMGVAYETIRFRIKKGQWHKLPRLFRTSPGGDWRCNPTDLEDFLKKMRGGVV